MNDPNGNLWTWEMIATAFDELERKAMEDPTDEYATAAVRSVRSDLWQALQNRVIPPGTVSSPQIGDLAHVEAKDEHMKRAIETAQKTGVVQMVAREMQAVLRRYGWSGIGAGIYEIERWTALLTGEAATADSPPPTKSPKSAQAVPAYHVATGLVERVSYTENLVTIAGKPVDELLDSFDKQNVRLTIERLSPGFCTGDPVEEQVEGVKRC